MDRFQVSITKFSGNLHPSMLHVDIKSAAFGDEDFNTLTVFDIVEPQVQSIRVEAKNDPAASLPKLDDKLEEIGIALDSESEIPSEIEEKGTNELKTVQILHKRKSAGAVLSSMTGSPLLNSTEILESELKIPVMIYLHSSDDDRSLQLNIKDMKYNEKIIIMVNEPGTGHKIPPSVGTEIVDQDANNNPEPEVTKVEKPDENNIEISPSSSVPEDAKIDHETSVKTLPPTVGETIERKVDEVETNANPVIPEEAIVNGNNETVISEEKVKEETGIEIKAETETVSPPSEPHLAPLVFSIANSLIITLEINPNPCILEDHPGIVSNIWEPFQEPSEESVVDPGALEFPWHNKGEKIVDTGKKAKQREVRKKLFKTLINERLLAFGLPFEDVQTITDTWNSGFNQQRVFSYRVPKVEPKWSPPTGLNPATEIQVKAESFAYNFLRHTEILQGTIDGATCTVIEATFFLILPHIQMSNQLRNSSQLETFTSVSFLRDWVRVIFTAAHQLKPSEPRAMIGIVKKETKTLRKLLKTVKRASSKIKHRFAQIQESVESLRKKAFRHVEPNPEWTADILERKKRSTTGTASVEHKTFGSIQIPEGLTAANLFENYLHTTIGRKGIVIKRHLTDPWFQLSNLNFLERRVLFLGLTDHMYTTFDTIHCTLRHLQELYTAGYPLNILARIHALFDLLQDKSRPYEYVTPQTRSLIYSKIYGLSQALDRFCYTFGQLAKLIKEAKHVLNRAIFIPEQANYYLETTAQEHLHINLIVPFATLDLKGLTEVKLRGRGLPHEKPIGIGSPEATNPN